MGIFQPPRSNAYASRSPRAAKKNIYTNVVKVFFLLQSNTRHLFTHSQGLYQATLKFKRSAPSRSHPAVARRGLSQTFCCL